MYKKVNLELATGEKKDFGFLACGTTGLRYKMTFGQELLGAITSIIDGLGSEGLKRIIDASHEADLNGQDAVELESLDPETLQAYIGIAGSGNLDVISRMAYIMNQQAEGADMKKLSVDGYLDWLEQFESMEFLSHALDFISIYMNNRGSSSTLKKDPALSIVK